MKADHFCSISRPWLIAVCTAVVSVALLSMTMTLPTAAAEPAEMSGVLIANGEEVKLPYVYVWVEEKGFHDPADPTWTILFVDREVEERKLGDPVWDAASVEIGVTEMTDFEGKRKLEIYLQAITLSAKSGGVLSGGTYPKFELEGLGTERISGRIYHTETQKFFDKSYSYDFTFSASLSDPNAPFGDPLPADGGDPGRAYLKWVKTVHSGSLDDLRGIVPSEMATELDSISPAEAQEQFEFMQEMTPTGVQILSGSTDGEIAILKVEGMIEGEKVTLEITMTRMGELWIPTESSM